MGFFDTFPIIRLRLHYIAAQPVQIKGYTGSALHGGLGAAIKRIAPSLYATLFDPFRAGKSIPKPFVLYPVDTRQEQTESEYSLNIEMVLFGIAIDYASIYLCALDDMARNGIAGKHNRFVLQQIVALTPNATSYRLYDHTDHAWGNPSAATHTAQDWINARSHLQAEPQMDLHFPTLLRLQDGNQLLRQPPDFKTLFTRLIGRINSLGCFYSDAAAVTDSEKRDLIETAAGVTTVNAALSWQDWDRYSARQKTWMKFGGLTGHLVYQGEWKNFLPYLLLGELIHVGSKTSFGLGKYIIQPHDTFS